MNLNCFETVELSDVGRKRKNNEDACLRMPERGVFCVADGMGGVVGGDLASEAIVTRLQQVFAEPSQEQPESFAGRVALFRQATNAASKWIREFAEDKVIGQMGSTLVALVFDPNNPKCAVGLHAGDSRLYRYRNGKLQLLTADHTAAAALVGKGHDPAKIPEKYQNELVRAVGLAETVELEKTFVDVASGDVFLLCSDGLTRMLSEAAISKALKHSTDTSLDQVAQALITGANEEGGKDNVTVILVKMGDLSGFPDATEPDDLDEPQTMAAPVGSESETLTLAKSGMHLTPNPDEPLHGHTPRTDDSPTMQGDTPSGMPHGQMHGDTPRTADPLSPYTPATELPKPPPKVAEEKKDGKVTKSKRASRKGTIIGVTIAVMAVAGVGLYFGSGSHSSKSDGGEPFQTPTQPQTPSQPQPHPRPQPPPAPLTGEVSIQSDPEGAEVFLLDNKVGVTPYNTNGVPAGKMSYTLMTPTRTGTVALLVKAGEKLSTSVTLAARLGTLVINSDPAGAEVWLEGKDKGKTPVSLECAAGQATVTLKEAGLTDQTAIMTVVASATNEANVVFPYGSVVIHSKPDGAAILQNGEAVGHTPYTNPRVPPGRHNWQLTAHGWQSTNVSVEVSDHRTSPITVVLQKEKGILQLTGNLPGVTARVDGAEVGPLPASVAVEADAGHTVTAEYKGIEQTKPNVRVQSGKANAIAFKFEAAPPPPSRWTNNLLGVGMEFVKLPGPDKVWTATRRVTLEQLMKVMPNAAGNATQMEENGQQYAVNLTTAMIQNFAAKLTEAAKGGGLPDEIKSYHFAPPTVKQWGETIANANKLGIQITNLTKVTEWCLDGDSWSRAGYMTDYDSAGNFKEVADGRKEIQPQPKPNEPRAFALRLVLVP